MGGVVLTGKKGAILVISLWILSALIILAAGLCRSAMLELRSSRILREKLEAACQARSQLNLAIAALESGKPKEIPEQASVEDLGARLNLGIQGSVFKEMLSGLLLDAGASETEAKELAETVSDWTDDDCILGTDPEKKEPEPAFFKNLPFCSSYELAAVMGYYYSVHPEQGQPSRADGLFNGIAGLVTVYPEEGVNLNSAGEKVLRLLCEAQLRDCHKEELISEVPSLVEKLLEFRKKSGFVSASSAGIIAELGEAGLTNEQKEIVNLLEGLLQASSAHFLITSNAQSGNARKQLKVVYNLKRHKIVDWHEN